MFDEDNSGSIENNELGKVMRQLGLNPSKEEIEDIVKEIDKDNDGTIDYSEFLRLMSTKLKDAQSEEELLEAF